ncbi:Uncharacterised protein [Pseudomonas aeruginosa]|nr:hypothetical protein Q088_04701 [Pseudomonas aeruginosa C41]MBK5020118.1 hypothetical protein [Pseudomonas sp. S68]RCM96168.1 hypothetical protein PA17_02157 [Pseudomonas aeruginosa]SVK39144.1 Uncharacterised protein [Acinetobacter baumannii]SQC81438.1 Uncharacterised protein [Pseudomonas aeruginosa]
MYVFHTLKNSEWRLSSFLAHLDTVLSRSKEFYSSKLELLEQEVQLM